MSTIPNPLPDHSSPAFADSPAGHGQPLYVEQLGQNYFADPYVPGGVATDQTSLAAGKYLEGLTMNRVYILLSMMIQSMQNTAVAQSNRLTILTDWQNAYNSKLDTIHSFLQSNGDSFDLGDTSNSSTATVRQDLNNANANYTTQVQANSNIVADDAKSQQTIINQTQNNINTLSTMATSLVQQFQTILASIYTT